MFKLKTNNIRKIAFGIIGVVIILCGIFYIYTLDYYRASPNVEVMLAEESDRISSDNGLVTIQPDNTAVSNIGLIFYPGGKVDGNHAYFGDYGEQEGDGKSLITRKKQQEIAVKEIVSFIIEN